MTLEKESSLFAKYSHLFEPDEIRTDPQQSCMSWGFECGDGWYGIIEKMMQEISDLHIKGFFFTQIKEKFGKLRVYTNTLDDQVRKILDKYEGESAHTCEVCGKPGTLHCYGWVSTRCEEHA